MIGGHRTRCIKYAVLEWRRRRLIRIAWIATGVRRRGPVKGGDAGSRVKLRQTIKRLIGESVLRPILTQRAEIVIEGPVFLRQENNVIDGPEIDGRTYRLVHRHVHCASRATAACAAPIYKIRVRGRCRGERDLRSRSEISRANCSAVYSGRIACNRSATGA